VLIPLKTGLDANQRQVLNSLTLISVLIPLKTGLDANQRQVLNSLTLISVLIPLKTGLDANPSVNFFLPVNQPVADKKLYPYCSLKKLGQVLTKNTTEKRLLLNLHFD
ncbi:hypothetical protein, partial [Chromatium okenii]|uniref:hypothetical protein n=1 Tax=Chromatium okenii TaxID=61644 RepID=UPI0026EA6BC4